tara:strand:+ start:76 stop:1068 length:993 start_codon:yes stop_codon:yes gene_type:complete
MANILILGAGSMGAAFSFPCSDNNHSVSIVGTHLENNFIDEINSGKRHPILKCQLNQKVKFLKFDKLLEEMAKKIDLIVIAVSSKGIQWVSNELAKVLKSKIPILILTKGLSIHNGKYEILANKVKRILKEKGVNDIDVTAVGGPCLAGALAKKTHTSVVIANENSKILNQIKKLISTDYYHVFTSNDLIGVEICAAIKNIFAMAVGSSIHQNTAAALFQQSINEMIIFTEKLNGKKDTVVGLAGIGDLFVSIKGGRNSRMGQYLGQGLKFSEAKKTKMPNDTVEGADLAKEIGKKIKSDFDSKTTPLMLSMIDTICDDVSLKFDWENFK